MIRIMMIDRPNVERNASCDASFVASINIVDVVRSSRQTYANHMSRRKRNASQSTTNDVVDVSSNVDVVATRVDDDATHVNAIDALNVVNATQRNDERDRAIALLKHALYNDESLTSRDKKTIRRTLRDTYDYYISRERRVDASNVVNRILNASNDVA